MFGSAGLATRIGAGMASDLDETRAVAKNDAGWYHFDAVLSAPVRGLVLSTGWTLISGAGGTVVI